ncbi:glycosyltransferase family 4 protein [Pedobacter immunditicola]|uniref:glycosyltransferase family 4 protein n=1 Tax=Pedobacter immunditicola TaxID=3133440 RepID=UPI00309B1429
MIIGIDASNIRQGGGVTHLLEILLNFNESVHVNISKVIVWAPGTTLLKLPDFPWLIKDEQRLLNGNIFLRSYWQSAHLGRLANSNNIDVLFSLCNNCIKGIDTVLICHSHLPLERKEINRYPWGLARLRLEILRIKFIKSYTKAKGIIFLTNASMTLVSSLVDISQKKCEVIPHGFNKELFEPKDLSSKTDEYVKLVYVSILEPYKHQLEVLQAVNLLIEEGYKLQLYLIGSKMHLETSRVNSFLALHGHIKDEVHLLGDIPYEKLNEYYRNADIFVYASTCESFGIILLEAMASKLPIACSDIASLTETLRDGGIYFNAEDPKSIKEALKLYLDNNNLRTECSIKAYDYSKGYSWKVCSLRTFQFLESI